MRADPIMSLLSSNASKSKVSAGRQAIHQRSTTEPSGEACGGLWGRRKELGEALRIASSAKRSDEVGSDSAAIECHRGTIGRMERFSEALTGGLGFARERLARQVPSAGALAGRPRTLALVHQFADASLMHRLGEGKAKQDSSKRQQARKQDSSGSYATGLRLQNVFVGLILPKTGSAASFGKMISQAACGLDREVLSECGI